MLSATQTPKSLLEVPGSELKFSGPLSAMPEFILSKNEAHDVRELQIGFDKLFNVVVSRHTPDDDMQKQKKLVSENSGLVVAGERIMDALWALEPDIDHVHVTPFESSGMPTVNTVFVVFRPTSRQIAWSDFGELAVRKIAEVINDEKLRLQQPAVLNGVLMTFNEFGINKLPIFIAPSDNAGQAAQA